VCQHNIELGLNTRDETNLKFQHTYQLRENTNFMLVSPGKKPFVSYQGNTDELSLCVVVGVVEAIVETENGGRIRVKPLMGPYMTIFLGTYDMDNEDLVEGCTIVSIGVVSIGTYNKKPQYTSFNRNLTVVCGPDYEEQDDLAEEPDLDDLEDLDI